MLFGSSFAKCKTGFLCKKNVELAQKTTAKRASSSLVLKESIKPSTFAKRNIHSGSSFHHSTHHHNAAQIHKNFEVGSTISSISIRSLTSQHIQQTVDCIGDSFVHSRDPFTISCNFSGINWGLMSQMFVQRAAENDLSFVAYDEQKDKVVGVILNEDWKERPPHLYYELEDWKAVRTIFYDLHMKFKEIHPQIEKGKVLHPLYFSCVRPELRKQGLIQMLWEKTVEMSRSRNFETVAAEASSPETENLLKNKLGFQEAARIDFESFHMHNGVDQPFKGLKRFGLEKLALYTRPIPSNLYI